MLKNQRDPVATKAADFTSPKSYVSFCGHSYLFGLADHEEMRHKLFERSKGICEGCERPHRITWDSMDWHHKQKTYGGRRCDGLCCGMAVCKEFHESVHRRELI